TLTLGIETSCDETSVAVVEGGRKVLANVIHSQVDLHREFGGVVPELAARDHLERLPRLLDLALEEAQVQPSDIDLLAVTRGPGLSRWPGARPHGPHRQPQAPAPAAAFAARPRVQLQRPEDRAAVPAARPGGKRDRPGPRGPRRRI